MRNGYATLDAPMKLISVFSVLVISILLLPRSAAIAHATPSSSVLVTAVYYDPFITGEASEAVQLQNSAAQPVALGNWTLSDGEGTVVLPSNATLLAKQKIWLAKSASAFETEFGFLPAYEYGGDSEPSVPDLTGSAPSLTNSGDQVLLKNDLGVVIDAMVYGNAALGAPDWSAGAVQPYAFAGVSTEGQILYRKMQESNGFPVRDTNSLQDWAQDAHNSESGKKVLYPGWSLDRFFQTTKSSDNATVKYCVAPDHLYYCVRDEILSATQTISMEVYALDNAHLVDELTAKLDSNVRLSALLDGGALGDQGKWACTEIEARGGQCWIMSSKPQANIHKRYDSVHAKWMIVDHRRILIGSENFGADAMPADDKRDGSFGTRGGFMISNNPTLVDAAQAVMDADFDPAHYPDIRRWGTNTDDFPPLGFVP